MAEEIVQVTKIIPSSDSTIIQIHDSSTWLAKLDKESRVKTRTGIGIPRVQFNLRDKEFNEGCFDPVLVSLGPYHHGKASLQCMEMYKIKAVKRFANDDNLSGSACDFYKKVESVALEAKNLYELSQPLSDDDFKKMIFLDSCFLLTFMDEYIQKRAVQGNDKTAPNWLLRDQDDEFVLRDMFLLENQIPFTVLNKLWSIKHRSEFTAENSILYSWRFLHECRRTLCGGVSSTFKLEAQFEPVHLLDLFRKQIIGQEKEEPQAPEKDSLSQKLRKYVCCGGGGGGGGGEELRSMPNSVTKMKDAGITCEDHPQAPEEDHRSKEKTPEKDGLLPKLRKYVCCCCGGGGEELRSTPSSVTKMKDASTFQLLNISFHNGLLRLPHIVINDHTKCLFLNMIAHEKSKDVSDIMSYIRFMSRLINKEEDVKELREHNVITNYLASDKHVVDLFNGLSKDLSTELEGYYDVREAVWDYNKRPWIRFRVWIVVNFLELYQKYFRSPWSCLALIAALLGLFLTAVSTYLTVFPQGEGKP